MLILIKSNYNYEYFIFFIINNCRIEAKFFFLNNTINQSIQWKIMIIMTMKTNNKTNPPHHLIIRYNKVKEQKKIMKIYKIFKIFKIKKRQKIKNKSFLFGVFNI